MKEMKDKGLEFVLRHYQEGRLDTQKAIRNVKRRMGLRRKRPTWHAVAATVAVLVCMTVGVFALFRESLFQPEQSKPQTEQLQGEQPAVRTIAPRHFHYTDTPINEVLDELSDYYGVQLSASDTTKRLNADFDADSLSQLLPMIEQVLGIEISETGK